MSIELITTKKDGKAVKICKIGNKECTHNREITFCRTCAVHTGNGELPTRFNIN